MAATLLYTHCIACHKKLSDAQQAEHKRMCARCEDEVMPEC